MMEKRAVVLGESVLMMYRILLITFIAVAILVITFVYYDPVANTRDYEARVLCDNVYSCVVKDGSLNLIPKEKESSILDYCGIKNTARFYVEVIVSDLSGNEIKKLQQGDSGALWVKQIFDSKKASENIPSYKSGYYSNNYSIYVLNNGVKINGNIKISVIIKDERTV